MLNRVSDLLRVILYAVSDVEKELVKFMLKLFMLS